MGMQSFYWQCDLPVDIVFLFSAQTQAQATLLDRLSRLASRKSTQFSRLWNPESIGGMNSE